MSTIAGSHTTIELIQNRRSIGKLREPAPTAEELDSLLACLLNAPDHGRIKPWQYWVMTGEGLHRLGDIFAQATKADTPNASVEAVDRARGLPLRAPMVLVAATRSLNDHPKVPVIEQFAAVAAGVQSLQLGLQAMGYGCMWRTGSFAYSASVKAALGLTPNDHIVGFVYIGTPAAEPKPPSLAAIGDHVSFWQ